MAKHTSTWKNMERRIAKEIGGKRLGATGSDTPDVVGEWLVVEAKHRETLPAWIVDALAKARKGAGEGQLGIAVLHEKGKRDSMVVLSWQDFRAWFGTGVLTSTEECVTVANKEA